MFCDVELRDVSNVASLPQQQQKPYTKCMSAWAFFICKSVCYLDYSTAPKVRPLRRGTYCVVSENDRVVQ